MKTEPPISISKFIEQSGLSASTVWRFRRDGILKTFNINGRQYVSSADLAEFNRRAMAGEFSRDSAAAIRKVKDGAVGLSELANFVQGGSVKEAREEKNNVGSKEDEADRYMMSMRESRFVEMIEKSFRKVIREELASMNQEAITKAKGTGGGETDEAYLERNAAIVRMVMNGCNDRQIARALAVSRPRVARVRKMLYKVKGY